MDKNKGIKKEPTSAQIDDFAKALLDKKTDMAVYKELNEHKSEETLSSEDRKDAERTLSSALDMLRKERGQMSIEEEEQEFLRNEEESMEEDFTTSSLTSQLGHDQMLKQAKDQWDDMSDEFIQLDIEPAQENTDQDKKEKVENTSENKKKINLSKRNMIIIGLVALLLVGGIGGYAYKVLVYDPQNVVTKEQQKAYDKLIAYADEWDMLSDSEKLEIVDMEADYKNLIERQKSEVNAYFKEQTSKSFTSILKEMKELKKTLEDESNVDYQQIVSFLDSWASKSEDDKLNILNLRATYDGLSSSLQHKVDEKAQEVAGKAFVSLCSDMEKVSQERQKAANAEKDKQKAEYQAQLDAYQSEYNQYATYADSLNQDLVAAQANGEDTSDIESQIYTNNELMNQAKANMDYYQSLIDSLG